MGTVRAVCMSMDKGTRKVEVESAEVRVDHGLVGDAHAGSGRQVSLLAVEAIERMRRAKPDLAFGDFAENLTTEGILADSLAPGMLLAVGGDVLLQITQIGKKCHKGCDIQKQVGYCIMPTEGVFAKVLRGGVVKAGDSVEIVAEEGKA